MGFAEAYTARKMAHKREEKQNTGFAAAYEARKTQLTAAQTGKRVDVGVDPYGTGARPAAALPPLEVQGEPFLFIPTSRRSPRCITPTRG